MDDASLQYLERSQGWEIDTGRNFVLDKGFVKSMSTTPQKGVYAFIFSQRGLTHGGYRFAGFKNSQNHVGKVNIPPNQRESKKKGGEIHQPIVYKEEDIKPSKQQEFKKKGGQINEPPPYREGEFGKPSKQQSLEKKPVTKGGETDRPTTQEKKKEIKPSEQTEQKKKEEKQEERNNKET